MATICRLESAINAEYDFVFMQNDKRIAAMKISEGCIFIKSLENTETTLREMALTIQDCFKGDNNFFSQFKTKREILFEYDGIKITVNDKNVKDIINRWIIKKKLLSRGVYYLIKVVFNGVYSKLFLVLATSEKAALNKMKGFEKATCRCIAIYNKNKNTIMYKYADEILDFSKIKMIED